MSTTYEEADGRTFKVDEEGQRTLLANFAAKITEEIRYLDGQDTQTFLTLEGEVSTGKKGKTATLPPIQINASELPGMGWVLKSWGVRCVIQPGSGAKDDLRTAIQLASDPKIVNIHKHLGWTRIEGKLTYLHAKGGITANGDDTTIQVALPPELAKYSLEKAASKLDGLKATFGLIDLAPDEIIYPLLAGTVAPMYGPCDFGIHVSGRTGTYKSELLSLFQSHYGREMDARHLPGSWSSTANALEAQAYMAKNAVFVIDDFVPTGTSWQVKAYQTNADKIMRAQGNQAGRARLTDTSNLQQTMYPRGIVFSSGEDTPEGHSVRARMLILELAPGEVKVEKLTKAQKCRHSFTGTIAALAKSLAAKPVDIRKRAQQIRDQNIGIGHSRTPAMVGHLIAAFEAFVDFAAEEPKALVWWTGPTGSEKEYQSAVQLMKVTGARAIIKAAEKQQSYLESADPVEVFQATIRQILGANMAHIRTTKGGVPLKPELLGWTNEQSNSDFPQYKSHGPTLGWINWDDDELYIDITAGYALIRKVAGGELSQTKMTLFKRLKDAGQLSRVDESRQRNVVRIVAEGHNRSVLAMPISSTLKLEEKP